MIPPRPTPKPRPPIPNKTPQTPHIPELPPQVRRRTPRSALVPMASAPKLPSEPAQMPDSGSLVIDPALKFETLVKNAVTSEAQDSQQSIHEIFPSARPPNRPASRSAIHPSTRRSTDHMAYTAYATEHHRASAGRRPSGRQSEYIEEWNLPESLPRNQAPPPKCHKAQVPGPIPGSPPYTQCGGRNGYRNPLWDPITHFDRHITIT